MKIFYDSVQLSKIYIKIIYYSIKMCYMIDTVQYIIIQYNKELYGTIDKI